MGHIIIIQQLLPLRIFSEVGIKHAKWRIIPSGNHVLEVVLQFDFYGTSFVVFAAFKLQFAEFSIEPGKSGPFGVAL